ncbi:hypothetical protein B0A58_06875 [Flavobacterium branchiophilum NBRC 15030 = ATCC 35035]|nr:hypothetical protein [Flavobacterium branchiophilum]OXA76756.1 hypothetical protein B0A58_06875 [Flavobacterium branchiophilum NBRC 15030 = ATCC 35035]GEM54136.1 hypothetical protein FB1_03570 [Flavobacterium branchiophilum NBRC 15030 = ATCC 35035]
MTLTEFTTLINQPDAIAEEHIDLLGKILDDFPYLQSARALRLKALYNQNSFKYNFALKVTAAHTTDRSVLFDFITASDFVKASQINLSEKTDTKSIPTDEQPQAFEEVKTAANEPIIAAAADFEITEKTDADVVNDIPLTTVNPTFSKAEQSIIDSINISEKNGLSSPLEEKLEIGKPLPFSKNEKHSFQEWLELAKFQPITRDEKPENSQKEVPLDPIRRKKLALIDKFIETSPKIPQIDKTTAITHIQRPKEENNTHLMTETLAKVYLEQKKYLKAIQAYEILILKYPEKSSLFANRILDIKNLQQNNN